MKRILLPVLLFLAVPPELASAQPVKLPADQLQEVTGGLLDLYFVMPVTIVHGTNTTLADASRAAAGAGAQAAGSSNINVHTDVRINSIDVFLNQNPALAGNGPAGAGANLSQMPVWVPWKQELRPLWFVGDMLAAFAR